VLKLSKGASSATEPKYSIAAGAKGELAKVPKVPATESADAPKRPAEAREKVAEEPELEESVGLPKILSPPPEPKLTKMSKAPAITPKRRRMASMLDTILVSTRAPTPASAKEAEAEGGPSVPIETWPIETRQNIEQGPSDAALVFKLDAPKMVEFPSPEASTKELDFIMRHALGKKLSEEEIVEAKHYAKELKYPKGSLVYNGIEEDDFLYCLPDNKEMSVCREMARNIGFRKLEVGLSAMSKDDLVDSLAYNSLKVKTF
jgi:hypothetical protein